MSRLIALDTETTGFSPKSGDRVVELAAIEIVNGRVTGRRLHHVYWPQRTVPSQSANVHGWTTEKLRGKPLFREKAAELADFLGDSPIWAHYASFDKRFLIDEMERAGLPFSSSFECSLRLAKKKLPALHNHKLDTLSKWAGLPWTGRAHTALADTEMLAQVLLKLLVLPDVAKPSKKKTVARPSAVQSVAPAPQPMRPMVAPTKEPVQAPRVLAQWTGSVAPANDPRLTPVTILHSPNQGKKWEVEEDSALRTAFLDGSDLKELCAILGRSPASIALRLEHQKLIAPDHAYAGFKKRFDRT